MLYEFIAGNRREICALCCDRIATRSGQAGWIRNETPAFLNIFLSQLVAVLGPNKPSVNVERSASVHGGSMYNLGYPISDVMLDYEDVGRTIAAMVLATGALVSVDDMQTVYKCVDEAGAAAAYEYDRVKCLEAKRNETQRVAEFAHELRNKASSALLGFQQIVSGRSPIDGALAGVITRSLNSLNVLVDRSILEARVDLGIDNRKLIRLRHFIDEMREDGRVLSMARGIELEVSPAPCNVDVRADPEILTGIVSNLLQNAFKFTPAGGVVMLRTSTIDSHVMIDVVDECGGLPAGKPEELFRAFEQRGKDRSGLGLGLFISRKGAEASGGELHVQDLPGVGCVFTLELPMALAS